MSRSQDGFIDAVSPLVDLRACPRGAVGLRYRSAPAMHVGCDAVGPCDAPG
jgi:hypothetical protein